MDELRIAASVMAALEEAELRLRSVVPPHEWAAWHDRAWRVERQMLAAATEGVDPYVPGSGFRRVYDLVVEGQTIDARNLAR